MKVDRVRRMVKTRKDHQCVNCNQIIEAGSIAEYADWKGGKYDDDGCQIGIQYNRWWMHDLNNEGCPEGITK